MRERELRKLTVREREVREREIKVREGKEHRKRGWVWEKTESKCVVVEVCVRERGGEGGFTPCFACQCQRGTHHQQIDSFLQRGGLGRWVWHLPNVLRFESHVERIFFQRSF